MIGKFFCIIIVRIVKFVGLNMDMVYFLVGVDVYLGVKSNSILNS